MAFRHQLGGGGESGHAGSDDQDVPGRTCHEGTPQFLYPPSNMAHAVTLLQQSNVECAMPSATAQRAVLTAHPSTPCDAIRSLQVCVNVRDCDVLTLEYTLEADLSHVRIPAQRSLRRAAELWQHTCFEAFVVTDDSPGYYELNFSPSGEWAAYRFSAYRTGMAPADGVGIPDISVERGPNLLQLKADLAIAAIREALSPPNAMPLRLALAAVIEGQDGRLSYWAQRHVPDKPDFHHPDGFLVEIPP